MTFMSDEQAEPAFKHQLNLINALNKLQHRGAEKVFMNGQEAAQAEEPATAHFAFSIGTHHFVVDAHCFCEVFVDVPIAALPNSPDCLLGLCNIRGLLIPIYKLHGLFNSPVVKKPVIFCVGKGERSVGLLVDALPTSLLLPNRDQVPSAQTAYPWLNDMLKISYVTAGKTWHLLDGNHLGEQLLLHSNVMQRQSSSARQDAVA